MRKSTPKRALRAGASGYIMKEESGEPSGHGDPTGFGRRNHLSEYDGGQF